MAQNNGNGLLDKLSGILGGDKVEQSTGATTAKNTQDAFSGELAGLGSLLGGGNAGQQVTKLLNSVKSLDAGQIQTVLGALKQSSDPQVQSATKDLAASQHDGETFVEKLKGYVSSLSQIIPELLPALQSLVAKK